MDEPLRMSDQIEALGVKMGGRPKITWVEVIRNDSP